MLRRVCRIVRRYPVVSGGGYACVCVAYVPFDGNHFIVVLYLTRIRILYESDNFFIKRILKNNLCFISLSKKKSADTERKNAHLMC